MQTDSLLVAGILGRLPVLVQVGALEALMPTT